MGELEPWMDENFIKGVFLSATTETVNVKVIRDKNSGNAGYCFVEFQSPDAATKALNLNGQGVPNSSRHFKLNWASGGGLVDRRYVLPCIISTFNILFPLHAHVCIFSFTSLPSFSHHSSLLYTPPTCSYPVSAHLYHVIHNLYLELSLIIIYAQ